MQPSERVSWQVFAATFLFLVGSAANMLAYGSAEPLLVAIILWGGGVSVLYGTALGGRFERAMFSTLFSVGWFMAGVAAVYVVFLHDPFQNQSDAALFFELSSGGARAMGIEEIRVLTTGSGAVALWRSVYEGFAALGFASGRYVGIAANVLAVAFSGVFAVKMARLLYGNDVSRFRRLITMCSYCGLLWLFAAIHLRDAFVLLGVTAIAYVWTLYLAKPGIKHLVLLGTASVFAFAVFGLLRTEFVFVPVVMLFAGLAALALSKRTGGSYGLFFYGMSLAGVVIAYILFREFETEMLAALIGGRQQYFEHVQRWSSTKSLGMALILDQPLPVRLVFGSMYLFVFPIPFWTGFQLESAYHLFKSANVIFFYFVTPLFVMSAARIAVVHAMRTPALLFNLFVVVGFTVAVAGTSLETRHFGAFVVPLLLVALLPDLNRRTERRIYLRWLSLFLSTVIVVHLAWLILKLQ